MFGFLVAAIANVGHQHLALEPTPHTVVNTTWLTPTPLDFDISIGLVPDELFGPLLDYLWPGQRSQGCHDATAK